MWVFQGSSRELIGFFSGCFQELLYAIVRGLSSTELLHILGSSIQHGTEAPEIGADTVLSALVMCYNSSAR
jgi:hypothetical protein